ncbi:hypothetical protein SAMN05421736_102125 [Evansella caseinilytica]|uniref:Uncharacterized protein n=1 Tax=Evansella caseinilytica TaxID=1503961 RepID=A0A1H3KEZ9_9BACI|nr:hypothetical protein [Evansella caseinilytica]SDY50385.1 hypothetical protein SAMN05421736_102125 [Evansella caseinilytica]
MNKKKVFVVPCAIFVILFLSALPFHYQVTEKIVEKQNMDQDVRGLFLGDDQIGDRRFRPREYIQVESRKKGDTEALPLNE